MSKTLKEIWVVLYDTADASRCLVSKAAGLCKGKDMSARAWLLSESVSDGDYARLAEAGADRITHIALSGFDPDSERAAALCIADAAKKEKPAAILFVSSVFSAAVAPLTATMLEAGISADCTELYWHDDGRLVQSRPTFGGRLQADIISKCEPAMATVRRGVFPVKKRKASSTGIAVEEMTAVPACAAFDILGFKGSESPLDLGNADILVSGGAGMGSRENFDKLYKLAELLGGEVSASRGAVACGFAAYNRQVGQTGVTVRPKIYMAFGISGAVQHVCGMMGSGKILAVNPDRQAPIHNVSDYSIYADANEVIDELIVRLGR